MPCVSIAQFDPAHPPSSSMSYFNNSLASNSAARSPHSPQSPTYPAHSDRGNMGSESPPEHSLLTSIVSGRKAWKTSKGGQKVWPPELEAALLEGLRQFVPDESRETRLLGRFPMRNRFISDFIMRTTGHERTPKQVGSRLQQLRDTYGGDELQSLLCPGPRPGEPSSRRLYYHDRESQNSGSSHGSPDSGHAVLLDSATRSPARAITTISVDILAETQHYQTSTPPSSPPAPPDSLHLFPQPRSLRYIDPTIAFMTPTHISAYAQFSVLYNGRCVHQEVTQLLLSQRAPSPGHGTAYLYSTSIVPGYWDTIVHSQDPTNYTIHQNVIEAASSASLFSAKIQFCYSPPPTPSPPPVYPRYSGPSVSYPTYNDSGVGAHRSQHTNPGWGMSQSRHR